MHYRRTVVSCLLAACSLAVACSTGGGTGGVPDDGRMVDRVASEKFEYGATAVGRDRDINLHRGDGLGLVYAPGLSVYLNSVMSRLVAVSPIERAPVRVFLQATPQWGASTSADANVYLNLGLLMGLENEDELAAVLAHELSHVILRHHDIDRFENTGENVKTMTRVAQGVEMGLLMGGRDGRARGQRKPAARASGRPCRAEHASDLADVEPSSGDRGRHSRHGSVDRGRLQQGVDADGPREAARVRGEPGSRPGGRQGRRTRADEGVAQDREAQDDQSRRRPGRHDLAKMVGPLGRKHRKAETAATPYRPTSIASTVVRRALASRVRNGR